MSENEPRIDTIFIEDELQRSYLDYSMSMITSRALPDVRDGLKPVHRRVLFGMSDLGLVHNRPTKKCARVVGDVIGKYHPHGDSAVYETLVRMAQDFSLRYPMVNGQGNFGSVDGDRAAAMRYTECRMTRAAEEMLDDLGKDTVRFVSNYDDSTTEPSVLPAKIPFLLVNGSTGIAVGMATNMAPHNMGEIVDALVATIDNPDIEISELIRIVPGPDFPTGGIIYGRRGISEAYTTGRGKVIVRAKAEVIADKAGKETIIVTEIPYMVNKATLIEKIAGLVRQKNIEGISFVRDESDRRGMRIVIGIRKDSFGDVVLNKLYKYTAMQSTFGINNLALVKMRPRQLNLKELLVHFLDHRHEVVTRRTTFELKKAQDRAHILEGLRIAIDNIDEIVEIIKTSSSPDEASVKLIDRFGLTEIQAKAILEMRLSRLTGLERDKIEEEYKQLIERIAELEAILASRDLRMSIIKEELAEVRERYADPRRTEITEEEGEVDLEDMIADEDMVVTMTREGYIKRCPLTTYRSQGRGGRGVKGMDSKDDDVVDSLFIASAHSYILFFTNTGRCYWMKVYRIPEGGRQSRGRPIVNLLQLKPDEEIASFVTTREFDEDHFIVVATAKGIINKQPLKAYGNVRRDGINAINLDAGDRLIECLLTDGECDVILGTKNGQAVRFHESAARELGRNTRGVKGVTLRDSDEVVAMIVAREGDDVLTVTEHGYGKRTPVSDYRRTNRGGSGIINIKTTERNGTVAAMRAVHIGDTDVMIISGGGIVIRSGAEDISQVGRNAQGVRLMNLGKGDTVVGLALCEKEVEEELDTEVGAEGVDDTSSAPAASESGEVEQVSVDDESVSDEKDSSSEEDSTKDESNEEEE